MATDHRMVVRLKGDGLPDDLVFETAEDLIKELNELGPIASSIDKKGDGKTKGITQDLAQIGIELLSAGAIKYVAQVLTAFAKRNSRISVQIGDLKISKDHATSKDTDEILKELKDYIQQQRHPTKTRHKPRARAKT
jgi:hypothetical protein